ncbi:hypothetical protein AOLI_G00283120 [Acnodon oligacanthus]
MWANTVWVLPNGWVSVNINIVLKARSLRWRGKSTKWGLKVINLHSAGPRGPFSPACWAWTALTDLCFSSTRWRKEGKREGGKVQQHSSRLSLISQIHKKVSDSSPETMNQ